MFLSLSSCPFSFSFLTPTPIFILYLVLLIFVYEWQIKIISTTREFGSGKYTLAGKVKKWGGGVNKGKYSWRLRNIAFCLRMARNVRWYVSDELLNLIWNANPLHNPPKFVSFHRFRCWGLIVPPWENTRGRRRKLSPFRSRSVRPFPWLTSGSLHSVFMTTCKTARDRSQT